MVCLNRRASNTPCHWDLTRKQNLYGIEAQNDLSYRPKEIHVSTIELRLRTTTSVASEISFFFKFFYSRENARSHVTRLGPTLRQPAELLPVAHLGIPPQQRSLWEMFIQGLLRGTAWNIP
jgi:hypothetical protein